jgi:hypothetical protein
MQERRGDASPFSFMSADDNSTEQNRKRVGVYDRPAGADRFRNVRVWVLVIAVAASVASAYFYLS